MENILFLVGFGLIGLGLLWVFITKILPALIRLVFALIILAFIGAVSVGAAAGAWILTSIFLFDGPIFLLLVAVVVCMVTFSILSSAAFPKNSKPSAGKAGPRSKRPVFNDTGNRSAGPAVNVDGTPMLPHGGVDVSGKPYGSSG